MGRPFKNGKAARTKDYRLPCTDEERERLHRNAINHGFKTDAEFGRQRLIFDEALTQKVGMSYREHLECLNLIAQARPFVANNKKLNDILDKLADSHYKATKDDK